MAQRQHHKIFLFAIHVDVGLRASGLTPISLICSTRLSYEDSSMSTSWSSNLLVHAAASDRSMLVAESGDVNSPLIVSNVPGNHKAAIVPVEFVTLVMNQSVLTGRYEQRDSVTAADCGGLASTGASVRSLEQ